MMGGLGPAQKKIILPLNSKMISFGAFDEQALGHEQALDTDFMVQ